MRISAGGGEQSGCDQDELVGQTLSGTNQREKTIEVGFGWDALCVSLSE